MRPTTKRPPPGGIYASVSARRTFQARRVRRVVALILLTVLVVLGVAASIGLPQL